MIYELFLDTHLSTIPYMYIAPTVREAVEMATPFITSALEADDDPMLSVSKYDNAQEWFFKNYDDLGDGDTEQLEVFKNESAYVFHKDIKDEAFACIDERIKKIKEAGYV